MLTQLHISDFAIIDELNLEFGEGFTVFTGETGAGKSIIIDAVEMLLGGRAEGTMLRENAEVARIEGVFELGRNSLSEIGTLLVNEELLDDGAMIVLAREIRRQGRNLCRINGRVVSLGMLKAVAEWLVDVHGQGEHLSLLRVSEHLSLLDRYSHSDLSPYVETYRNLIRVRTERSELDSSEREQAQREDLLRYQIQEIEAAALQPEELPQLAAERDRLANAEKLAGLTLNAIGALEDASGSSGSAIDRLSDATGALISLGEIDPTMEAVSQRAQGLSEELSQLAAGLRDYLENAQPDPLRLDEVEGRLGLIRDLRRKYGDDIQEILDHAEKAKKELGIIEHSEVRLAELRAEEERLLIDLAALGEQLSGLRRESADALSGAVESQLAALNMQGARFGVDLDWNDDPNGVPIGDRRIGFGAAGLDRVEFLIAPNVGEGLKPLAKVASGGETSRLMLGLKSVLAGADRRPTLIFDEIDQGIGGRVGSVVGLKLKELARSHQVLCVTHLPQLAAHADQHFQVSKRVEAGRTLTAVSKLDQEQRLDELAEMLGDGTEVNRRSAAGLLEQASEVHKSVAA